MVFKSKATAYFFTLVKTLDRKAVNKVLSRRIIVRNINYVDFLFDVGFGNHRYYIFFLFFLCIVCNWIIYESFLCKYKFFVQQACAPTPTYAFPCKLLYVTFWLRDYNPYPQEKQSGCSKLWALESCEKC